MRLVAVSSIQDQVVLAENVLNSRGQVLLRTGAAITPSIVKRLLSLGISYVYIEDSRTDGIFIKPALKESTRKEAIAVMSEAFSQVKSDLASGSKKFNFYKMEKQFTAVVRDIINQIKNRKEAIDLLTHLYAHDNYIFTHSLNVTVYTLALAMKLNNLTPKQTEEIGLGAMLHDIGKMMIPASVLKKAGRLTDEEYELMKQHTEFGFELLRREHCFPLTSAHCALQHHERLDGSGYPRGLKGTNIHLFGRMMGIADVYDAVTSNRVYRKAMLPHEGMEILYTGSGTEFDTGFIEMFRKAIVMYPTGLTIWLNDGRKGIVYAQNEHISDRPVVLILEEEGQNLDSPYEVNMATETTLFITETDTTLAQK